MAITDKNTIKEWFKTFLIPTQEQFWAFIDSYRHKGEKIPLEDIEGIDNVLANKANKNAVDTNTAQIALKQNKSEKGQADGFAPLNENTKIPSQYLQIIDDLVTGGSTSLASAETVKQLKQQLDDIPLDSTSVGAITPDKTIPPTINVHGFAAQAGTYANCGDVVVPANSLAFISRVGGVWSISSTVFDLSEYQKKVDSNKIKAWVGQPYLAGSQTNYIGKDWVNTIDTLSTDVPGTSLKWVERLTGYAEKLINYATPPTSSLVTVNDIAKAIDNSNFGGSFVFAPTDNKILSDGYITRFRTKLSNAEVGRKVRFYILRQTTGLNYTVIYDSGDVVAELNGVNTYSPELGAVKVSINDIIACRVLFISNANAQRMRDSGGAAIATSIRWSGDPIVTGSTYLFTSESTNIKFSIDADVSSGLDLYVGRNWGNKPHGYVQLNSGGTTEPNQLPIQISGKVVRDEAPVVVYRNDLTSSAIQRSSGSILTVDNSPGYLAPAGGYNSIFANKMIICSPTNQLGFASGGILTEVRVGKNTTVVATSKIQAWIVRPLPTDSNQFTLVEKVGEIDGSVAGRWHIFSGLGIMVNAGDRIAIRGIDVAPSYFSGSTAATPYSNQTTASFTPTDLTMDAFSSPVLFSAPSTGIVWAIEATISKTAIGARNVAGGMVGLDHFGKIPNTIGKAADLYWQGKKIIWTGTSIPAGNELAYPSYPFLVGKSLDANLHNGSVGSSGVIWDGTRELSLAATSAELVSAFTANSGVYSYESIILGRGADLIVFDHGYNDRLKAAGATLGTLPWTSRSGTITTSTISATVTGVGTLFTTEIKVGDKLYDFRFRYLGKILSIQSNTSLTLVSNALHAVSAGGLLFATSMDRSTFYGAFNYVIDKCYDENPLVSIAFVTSPTQYAYQAAGGDGIVANTNARNATIALANAYNAPVCDLFKLMNYNGRNWPNRATDNVHPNPSERVKAANFLHHFIKGIS